MPTSFPDTNPLPEQTPEHWDAMPDWANVRTLDQTGRHKAITVYLDAPDPACAEARALITLLLESEWNLHGASAKACENDGDGHRVEVDVPNALGPWGKVHLATGELAALWASATQAAP